MVHTKLMVNNWMSRKLCQKMVLTNVGVVDRGQVVVMITGAMEVCFCANIDVLILPHGFMSD